ncbi:hypothetical protein LCGC14_2872040 [marine sediment metagenome]|uniref:Uncharacterized protein n=1 Tax=marine sediment metagenome TaxID=412755 RepID=A0A0F8YPD9_9ZZZZ
MKTLFGAGLGLLIVCYCIGVMIGYQWGKGDATEVAVDHDRGRTAIVFNQFCDGWPENPTPLRCARVVWCWTHRRREAIDWPLAEAIPFLKELEASYGYRPED